MGLSKSGVPFLGIRRGTLRKLPYIGACSFVGCVFGFGPLMRKERETRVHWLRV